MPRVIEDEHRLLALRLVGADLRGDLVDRREHLRAVGAHEHAQVGVAVPTELLQDIGHPARVVLRITERLLSRAADVGAHEDPVGMRMRRLRLRDAGRRPGNDAGGDGTKEGRSRGGGHRSSTVVSGLTPEPLILGTRVQRKLSFMAWSRKKRLAVGISAVLLAFTGLLVTRAATLSSKQPQVAPLPPALVDGEAVAKILGKAIARKTVSTSLDVPAPPAELEGLHTDLEAAFPKLHGALKKEKVGESSLLYTWQGTDASLAPIILCAHMDVVPVEPGTETAWTHPAFDGLVEGGFVWGRGALDDKGSLITILAAVEMLVSEGMKPARTVYLAFGQDEEISGKAGAAKIVDLLASRNVKAEMALDEGSALVEGVVTDVPAPVAAIGIAEKGYVSVDLRAELAGGHSSTPAPENALTVLARAIDRVTGDPMPARIDGATGEFFAWAAPEMPFGLKVALANTFVTGPLLKRKLGGSQTLGASIRTTTAPTMFNAGVKDNVVPTKASATINFRVLPGDTTEDVLTHVKRAVDDARITVTAQEGSRTEPSPVSRSSSRAFGLLAETVREVFPGTVVAPSLVLGATDGRWYARVAADVYRFMPFRLGPADIARVHGKDERLSISNISDGVRFYRRVLEKAAK